MILIPEQISDLRKQREKLLEKIETYNDYLRNKETMDSDRNANTIVGDSLVDGHYHKDKDNLSEINYLLDTGEYLKERTLDKIDIGTKFIVDFDTLKDTKTVILTESIYGLGLDKNFVSLESLLGQNVIGKKEGDSFSYVVVTGKNPKDKRKISGHILEIKKDPTDYLHFIRETTKSKRITETERLKLQNLKASEKEEDKKELATYELITPSQQFLLELEKDKLSKRKDTNSIRRLEKVKKLLKHPIAPVVDEDVIGIGSKFEIALALPGEEPVIEKYEMINCALSDELNDDYVERISPLGHNVYGLHTNDTFKIRRDKQTYRGVVINVENQKTNRLNHQYTKK